MVNFGLTGMGAEIVDVEKRGKERVLTILSRGITERAAVRSARIEAAPVIPLRDQDVTRSVVDREISRLSTRYIVTVAHNPERY